MFLDISAGLWRREEKELTLPVRSGRGWGEEGAADAKTLREQEEMTDVSKGNAGRGQWGGVA